MASGKTLISAMSEKPNDFNSKKERQPEVLILQKKVPGYMRQTMASAVKRREKTAIIVKPDVKMKKKPNAVKSKNIAVLERSRTFTIIPQLAPQDDNVGNVKVASITVSSIGSPDQESQELIKSSTEWDIVIGDVPKTDITNSSTTDSFLTAKNSSLAEVIVEHNADTENKENYENREVPENCNEQTMKDVNEISLDNTAFYTPEASFEAASPLEIEESEDVQTFQLQRSKFNV